MKTKIFAFFIIPLSFSSFSTLASSSYESPHVGYSTPALQTTKQALKSSMGISSEYPNTPISKITLPIYPKSLVIVNNNRGMNFDDQHQTLPFATFISDQPFTEVIKFYGSELPSFQEIKNDNDVTFVADLVKGGKYPDDYYHIENVNIKRYPLSNHKMGTLFSIMYHK